MAKFSGSADRQAEFRRRTKEENNRPSYTSFGYWCKGCRRYIRGTGGRKKVIGGEGFRCPECVNK